MIVETDNNVEGVESTSASPWEGSWVFYFQLR